VLISIKKEFLDTNGSFSKFNIVNKLLVIALHESNIVYALDKNHTYKMYACCNGVIVIGHSQWLLIGVNKCHQKLLTQTKAMTQFF